MTMQLDLLTYRPTEEEMAVGRDAPQNQTPIAPSPNQHAIAYHEARAAYYLRLMSRFVGGTRCSPEVKRHETTRLFEMRLAALEKARRLRDA